MSENIKSGRLAILGADRARAAERARAAASLFNTEHQLALDLSARLRDAVADGRLDVRSRAWHRYVNLFVTPQTARSTEAHIAYDRARTELARAVGRHTSALMSAGLGTDTRFPDQPVRARPMSPPYRPLDNNYGELRQSIERRQRDLAERDAREAAISSSLHSRLMSDLDKVEDGEQR